MVSSESVCGEVLMSIFGSYPVGLALRSAGLKPLTAPSLIDVAKAANEAALKCDSPWALLDSGLTQTAAQPVPNSRVLVIDAGGTNTRGVVRSVDNEGSVSWKELFSKRNEEWTSPVGTRKPLVDFGEYLGTVINDTLGEEFAKFDGVSVVWSNSATSEFFAQGIRGIGARVSGVSSTYVKGEPFVAGLNDGDSLHELILLGLGSKIDFPVMIIGNDTVFTQLAEPGSAAGIICSTGTNTTLNQFQPDGSAKIYNSESGHKFVIPPTFLSKAERVAFPDGIEIEKMTAGAASCIPELFSLNLKEILNGIAGRTRDYSTLLELFGGEGFKTLSAPEISALANSEKSAFPADVLAGSELSRSEQMLLQSLARNLHERGGHALASLTYFSVADQLQGNNKDSSTGLIVSLDSAVARNSEIFLKALMDGVSEINQSLTQGKITVKLVSPLACEERKSVSVPTLGAANAIDSVLAS
jgi:hypothetical protein